MLALMVASLMSLTLCKLDNPTVAGSLEAQRELLYIQTTNINISYIDIPIRAYEWLIPFFSVKDWLTRGFTS